MIGKLGEDEGDKRGPPPGEGATIHSEGSAPDIENTQPQELPHLRGAGRLLAEDKSSGQGARLTWLGALVAMLAVIVDIILLGAAVVHAV